MIAEHSIFHFIFSQFSDSAQAEFSSDLLEEAQNTNETANCADKTRNSSIDRPDSSSVAVNGISMKFRARNNTPVRRTRIFKRKSTSSEKLKQIYFRKKIKLANFQLVAARREHTITMKIKNSQLQNLSNINDNL